MHEIHFWLSCYVLVANAWNAFVGKRSEEAKQHLPVGKATIIHIRVTKLSTIPNRKKTTLLLFPRNALFYLFFKLVFCAIYFSLYVNAKFMSDFAKVKLQHIVLSGIFVGKKCISLKLRPLFRNSIFCLRFRFCKPVIAP